MWIKLGSKSYCPFCIRVKELLGQLGANFKGIELDVESPFFLSSSLSFYRLFSVYQIISCIFAIDKHDFLCVHELFCPFYTKKLFR